MRAVAALLAMLALGALAPGAAAAEAPSAADAGLPTEAEALLALPAADARGVQLAFLAQLARGGVVADGVVAAVANPLPPATVFQDVHPTCDLDGDGVTDAVSNDFRLSGPPSHANGDTTVRAVSGANGTTLWTREALGYGTFRIGEASTERPGRPFPADPGNVLPSLDLDGDGVCDMLAIGYDGDDNIAVPPVFTVASVATYLVEVRALSGRTGEDLWVVRPDPVRANANTPLLPVVSASVVRGFPTGFLAFTDEQGPRFVLKTTDIAYTMVQDPFGLQRIRLLPRQARLLDDRLHYESLEITEHVQLRDAKDGALLWQRDLVSGTEGGSTNLTWITGVADLSQDGAADVVLDQLVLTNPRGTEMDHPLTGQPLYRYGRGMAVLSLDGAAGGTVWEATVLDPLAAQPNPPVEELFEAMVWTHAEVVDDLDGDGADDVMASYVAREENLGATVSGAFRTHFLPLRGSDGTALWDVRQQGWGFLRTLGSDGERTLLGLGMVDVPSAPAPGDRFPEKFVRLGALDAADGTTVWSYEHAFAQQSMLSYHLSLAQYDEALAPFDADGDGVLDVLSPSQAALRTERDQLLLATASHAYELRSGADGSVLRAVTAWGVDGRALECGSPAGTLTVLTGHARRLDLTRFDLATGEQVWRRPVWNDPAPRAATSAIDLVGVGARCRDLPDGRTFVSLDLQEFSFDRGHEVVAIVGFLDAAGAPTWIAPAVRGDPPTVDIFEPYREPRTGPSALAVAAFAAPAGAAAGVAALALGSRAAGSVLGRLLGVGLVAMLLLTGAPMAAPPATALDAPLDLAPALLREPAPSGTGPTEATLPATEPVPVSRPEPEPVVVADPQPEPAATDVAAGLVTASPVAAFAAGLRELGPDWTPRAHVDLTRDYLAAVGAARMDTAAAERRLEENETVAFSYEIGDVDGDGVEDVLLDDYCVDYDVCYGYGSFPAVLLDWTVSGNACASIHRVEAVSGANGTLLWEKDLTVIAPLYQCGDQFVIGTVPTEAGVGILVYRLLVTNPAFIWTQSIVDHTVYLVDAATGEVRWEFTERGVRAGDFLTTDATDSVLVNPVLMVPPANGVGIVPEGTQPALFLQGVGYVSSTAHTLIAPPGAGRPLTLLDAYHPREWAARLDLQTGEVLWRVETFRPELGESVLPEILDQPAYEPDWYLPDIAFAAYWDSRPCCLDTTGDAVPDLAYRVLEWSATPSSKIDEDLFLDSRVVTLDGASGDVVVDRYVAEDVAVPPRGNRGAPDTFMRFTLQGPGYELWFELLGDVDGDGAGDYLQHQVFYRDQYWHVLSAVSGKDATELWRIESPRDLRAFVLGDADGDGGNDVMLVDWYGWERRQLMYSELVTPARTFLTLYDGREGDVLWRAETFSAPFDAVQTFLTMRNNGLADLDGDGVADVVVDDPLYLGDQTVVHRLTWLSGRDASTLATSEVVGAFAVPSRIADVTGDGLDDVALLSGDVNDLWLTVSEGTTGSALWSRRLLAVPSSGYAEALPNLRFHVLEKGDGSAPDVVTNLHLRLRMMATGTYIYINGEGETGTGQRTYTYQTLWPQILHTQGTNGRVGWAFPSFDDPVRLVSVLGETPGTAVWHRLLGEREADAGDVVAALPATGAGAGSFLGAFGAVFLVGRAVIRRRRADAEVPDLV